jgi:hypothetical protein
MTMNDDKNFDRETLEYALAELGRRAFARAIGLDNSQDAQTLVEKFYPQNMLQPKTRLGLEEIFSNLDVENGNHAPAPWGPP